MAGLGSPRICGRIRGRMIPKRLQGVLWSKRVSKLDKKRDAAYIVHQVLAHGGWQDLGWLIRTYGLGRIKRVFLDNPFRGYRPEKLNFAARILLGLKGFDEGKYGQTQLGRSR